MCSRSARDRESPGQGGRCTGGRCGSPSPRVSAPFYDVLLLLHIAAGLVGFGAIAVAGLRARAGRRSPDPGGDSSLRRFFAPGSDWPARAIFLVPLLGLALLLGGDWPDVSAAWPWIGLIIWIGAAGIATGGCWPAERSAQEALAHLEGAGDDEARSAWTTTFRASCRRMERSVGCISLCFLAAVAVMVVQPR